MNKNKLIIILAISFGLLLSACASNDSNENSSTEENSATETNTENLTEENNESNSGDIILEDLQGNEIKLEHTPERIISLTAGDLNTIYALGEEAVGRPVIRGKISEELEKIEEVGTSNDVNIEKIVSLNPDVVIAHPQLNKEAIPTLEDIGIDVIQTGASSIDEVKQSIELIGKLFNQENRANEIVTRINDKLTELNEKKSDELRTLVVFGVAGNWMAALPDSLSGNLLEAVGHFNIARDYPKLERFPQYAQLDSEKIVEADPEVILFITPGPFEEAVTAFSTEMEKNPAWNNIQAVKNDHFINLPNELFGVNPGSEIIESLDYLSKEMDGIAKQYDEQ